MRKRIIYTAVVLVLCSAFISLAQFRRGRGGWRSSYDVDSLKTARQIPASYETPTWTNTTGFEKDVFTFARVIFRQDYGSYGSRRSGGWETDCPDSDLNFSYRLQQVTSLKVDPNGRLLKLTDKELFNYPWIYMAEPGRILLDDDEVQILRKYLLNGGFLMADDFWGELQWDAFQQQLKRVFPERDFVDLKLDHPIFHCVFEIKGPMNKLQVPNIQTGTWSEQTGVTYEEHDGEACEDVHIRAILDDKGRIMVVATHNTDNGDGWEREGVNVYYFQNFSEKIAYPLGINIIYYAMTH